MLIEAEAKTKWCPFVRALIYQPDTEAHNYPVNRETGDIHCLGSACMAWRDSPHARMAGEDRAGFCGLAGKP